MKSMLGYARLKTAKASDIMSQPVVSVFIKDTVQSVANLFLKHDISGVPVLGEDGHVVGVMTKTDLARYDERRLDLLLRERLPRPPRTAGTGEAIPNAGFRWTADDETIEQWLTPKVYWVLPDTPLTEAASLMARHHVHHLFVKSPESRDLIGVITTFDLLKAAAAPGRAA